jgi:hypothetical protein
MDLFQDFLFILFGGHIILVSFIDNINLFRDSVKLD